MRLPCYWQSCKRSVASHMQQLQRRAPALLLPHLAQLPCQYCGVTVLAVLSFYLCLRLLLCRRLYIVDMLPMIHKAVALAASNAAAINQQYQQQQYQHAGGEQGAAHQVIASLLDLLRRSQEPPTHMAVVVDVPGPTFRCGLPRAWPQAAPWLHTTIVSLTAAAGSVHMLHSLCV